MKYQHTQRGPIWLLLLALSAITAVLAWFIEPHWPMMLILGSVAALFLMLAFAFRELTIADHGDRLVLRFGPLPLLRTSVRYAELTSASVARSSFIDGWGIHYIPGRGWTYNLWGYDCVETRVGTKVVRIGTDDAPALRQFLQRVIDERSRGVIHPA